jgi:hypothetical protein
MDTTDNMAAAIAARAPERFIERDGKLMAKFDRIILVKHPTVGNIVQYQMGGEVVINHKLPPALDLGGGEITIDGFEGLMPMTMEEGAHAPDA